VPLKLQRGVCGAARDNPGARPHVESKQRRHLIADRSSGSSGKPATRVSIAELAAANEQKDAGLCEANGLLLHRDIKWTRWNFRYDASNKLYFSTRWQMAKNGKHTAAGSDPQTCFFLGPGKGIEVLLREGLRSFCQKSSRRMLSLARVTAFHIKSRSRRLLIASGLRRMKLPP